MGLLSLNLPVIGQSSATEDQKVRDALNAIQTDYNGNLTDANISATAAIKTSKFATGVDGTARGSYSAFRNTAVSLTSAQTVVFDAEEDDDVSGWFDTGTGAFTPQVAGYYRLSWMVSPALGTTVPADGFWRADLAKNGTRVKNGMVGIQRGSTPINSLGTARVKANGTTDAFTITIAHSVGAAAALRAAADGTYFHGDFIGPS